MRLKSKGTANARLATPPVNQKKKIILSYPGTSYLMTHYQPLLNVSDIGTIIYYYK